MLNFKPFYELQEVVKLLRNETATFAILNAGLMGWWNVFITLENSSLQNRIYTLNDYLNLMQSSGKSVDPIIEKLPEIKKEFENAAYKLASLGFPKMRQRALIEAHSTMNQGAAGLAYKNDHGIKISKNHIKEYVIIHEHAHMYWFNLPKENRAFFEKHYKETVINTQKYDPYDVWKIKHGNNNPKFDIDKNLLLNLCRSFGENVFNLKDVSEKNIYMDTNRFFKLKEAINSKNEQKIIAAAVLRYKGSHCRAKLKKTLNSEFVEGQIIDVESHQDFIINKLNRKGFQDEYPKPLTEEQLFEFVEFDISYLTERELEAYEDSLKMAKLNPFHIFASEDKKEEIEEGFKEIVKNYLYNDPNKPKQKQMNVKYDIKHFNLNRIFTSWVAVISRRFKNDKISTYDDFIKAVFDTLVKKINTSSFEPDFTSEKYKNWDDESMIHWRKASEKLGYSANEYGAKNVYELWATAVEYAAMQRNSIHPQLLKLIYKTINGF